jgi:cbb3-type cytochrome oxidase subunit 1/mono/diheme cytochrome c family protein
VTTTAETLEAEAPAPEPFHDHTDRAVKAHLQASLVLFAVGLLGLVVLAVKLIEPEFLGGVAFLSYGRMQPMVTSLLLYGWLTIGLLGAVWYVVPRATGAPLHGERLALVSLGLVTLGLLAGVAGIGAGLSEGRRYLEMPIWADGIVALGLVAATVVVTRTVQGGDVKALSPVQWYLVAAVHWLLFIHVVGNIPGLTGLSSMFQESFFRAGLVGLWVGAAGVGVTYFLIPRLTGRPAFTATQMSVLGFWSLAFLWALTAPAELTYGPGGDWLDTIGIIFSICLLVAVLVILADIVTAMRGMWHRVGDRLTLRLLMAGAVCFAILPLLNLIVALRSSNTVVGYTDWGGAYESLAVLGAGSLWLAAWVRHAAPEVLGRPSGFGSFHYVASLTGLALVVGSQLLAGAVTGFTWAAAANSAKFINAGDGWLNTAATLELPHAFRVTGVAVFTAAQLAWIVASFGGIARPGAVAALAAQDDSPEPEVTQELLLARPLGLGRLRTGYVGLFAVAALFALVLPSLDQPQAEPTRLADAHRYYPDGAPATIGRQVFIAEGCVACHTQSVRPIVTDVGLGAVSQPGDYARETPVQVGWVRLGPDLMHAGSRDLTSGASFVTDHLADPRRLRPWSIMPSYDYLSDRDLNALGAYIAGLASIADGEE